MTTRIRAYHQGASVYVIGTPHVREAVDYLPPQVHHWHGSHPSMYARRKNGWRDVYSEAPNLTPKDARPGVLFAGCRDSAGNAATAHTEAR